MSDQPVLNTDRELFREDTGDPAGSYYENSVHVTQSGAIGMNVGGTVIVRPIVDWHAQALRAITVHYSADGEPLAVQARPAGRHPGVLVPHGHRRRSRGGGVSDQSRTRVVGWGPFRLPGERRRRREARERAVAELLVARSLSSALDGEPEAVGDEDGPS